MTFFELVLDGDVQITFRTPRETVTMTASALNWWPSAVQTVAPLPSHWMAVTMLLKRMSSPSATTSATVCQGKEVNVNKCSEQCAVTASQQEDQLWRDPAATMGGHFQRSMQSCFIGQSLIQTNLQCGGLAK